jgi:hypothetical protein
VYVKRLRAPRAAYGWLGLVALLGLFGLGSAAHAQAALYAPAASTQAVAAPDPSAAWRRLEQLRLVHLAERRREGLALFVWGAANTLGGAVVAGVQHDDRAWLTGSLTTLSFGAINALLALPLLDLSGARRAAIEREQAGPAQRFAEVRERESQAQLKSGQIFALNTGLDVFYLATGAFLLVMAQQGTRHADWERGVGAAFLGQGAFLLGFDISCWIGSNRRAAELRALR